MSNASQDGIERMFYVYDKIYPCIGTHPLLSETAVDNFLLDKSLDNVNKRQIIRMLLPLCLWVELPNTKSRKQQSSLVLVLPDR